MELTKDTIQKLMGTKGETRGVVFRTDAEFLLKEKGKDCLKEVQEELKKMGFPLDYKKIKPMFFYPVGLRVLSLLAIQRVLNLSNEEIKRMGALAPKTSFIIQIFAKHFLSVARIAMKAEEIWKRHYTAGELSAEVREDKKYAFLRLQGLTLHPVFCSYLEGYFSTVLQMVVRGQVECHETKCSLKGDKYHEFLLKW